MKEEENEASGLREAGPLVGRGLLVTVFIEFHGFVLGFLDGEPRLEG